MTFEPTCTTAGGYDTVVRCTVCNEVVTSEHTDVSELGHTNGAPTVENNVDPTCTTAGSYDTVVRCTVCGEVVTSEHTDVSELGHTNGAPAVENNVEATCTTAGGYDTVVRCTVCGEVVTSEHTEEEAFGHTNGAPTEEDRVEATATTHGSYNTVVRCTVCGEIVTSESTTLHYEDTPVIENKVVSTSCTHLGGYDTVVYCTVCEGVLSRVRTNEAVGHNFDSTTELCTVCGASDKLRYSLLSDGTYEVVGESSNKNDFIIPTIHTSLTGVVGRVTRIGASAFQNTTLHSLIIPEGVTSIGRRAIYDQHNLITIILPDSIELIENQAFIYSDSIKNIVIGSGLKTIEKNAFYECTGIEKVYYHGTINDWAKISIDATNNTTFLEAPRYYYSETQPAEAGNYWHYVDGVITEWPAV